MHRREVINHLIQKFGYKNYLEIGVRFLEHTFNNINIEKKTSVDPGYESTNDLYDYKMESDDFFENLRNGKTEFLKNHTWDIIFIDGSHLSYQVERDMLNSLEHLSPNGTIVMHDCSPRNEMMAIETFVPGSEWCGTVWKPFYKFRHSRPDLEMTCVDTDYGIGIIRRGKQELAPFDNPYYDFNKFAERRKEYLNLITVDEFIQKF